MQRTLQWPLGVAGHNIWSMSTTYALESVIRDKMTYHHGAKLTRETRLVRAHVYTPKL